LQKGVVYRNSWTRTLSVFNQGCGNITYFDLIADHLVLEVYLWESNLVPVNVLLDLERYHLAEFRGDNVLQIDRVIDRATLASRIDHI
jgi:hypothetical protein